MDGHIDLADLERLADEVQASGGRGLGQGLGGEGSGHDRAAAALAESYRLQGIVNNTLASLIDVSLRCVCVWVLIVVWFGAVYTASSFEYCSSYAVARFLSRVFHMACQ